MFLGLPLWGLGAVLISSIDVRVALRRFAGQFLSCSEALDQGVSLGTHCVGQGREEPDWGIQLRPSSVLPIRHLKKAMGGWEILHIPY